MAAVGSETGDVGAVTSAILVVADHALRRIIGVLAKIGYCVAFALIALVGMLWCFQEKLLFYPKSPQGFESPEKNPKPYQHPAQMGMAYEDVWLTTEDGCRLHAWLIKQKSPLDYRTLPTALFFQGNAGNMGLRLQNLHRLYQHCRINILALSYRGYGYSSGVPSEQGVYKDAQAGLDYLLGRPDIDANKLILFGRSIGGAVAIDLAFKRSNALRAVIVENTFTNIKEMTDIVFPFLKLFSYLVVLAQRLFMDSISKVPFVAVPTMYISGLQDALVPPAHAARLYNATTSAPLRRLYPVTNGGHNDTWQRGGLEYYKEISKFIVDALAIAKDPPTTCLPKKDASPS